MWVIRAVIITTKEITIMFYKKLISLSVLVMATTPALFSQKTDKRPNVLFLFADDHRWDSIRALGNGEIITPNLDKLVNKSVTFSNGFCFGGNSPAVCIPARNMMMSGKVFLRFEEDQRQYKKRGEKRPARVIHTNPNWDSFPKSMKKAGYETYFDEKSGYANNPHVSKQFDHHHAIDMPKELATGRAARTIVNDAIKFLKNGRDKSKPVFMYLGLPCPHDPRWAAKRFRDMYNPNKLTIPSNYLPQHPYNITDMTIRDEALEKWPRTKADIRRHTHDYYSLITSMDYDIGRLLDSLKELGMDENTIIIYSADQGLAMGSKGLLGKQSIYDDVMRVPFFISGPGIKKSSNSSFVYTHDIYPTVCDLVGAKIPNGLDGKSLRPIIEGKVNKVRDLLMMGYKNKQRSVSNGKWKIIRYPHIDYTELFHVAKDPREINNLADNPEYKTVKERMLGLLKSEQKKYNDILPLTAKKLQKREFVAPKKKLKTPFPAGGLAPKEDDTWDFK